MAVYSKHLGGTTGMALAQAIARSILASRLQAFNRRDLTHKCRAFRDNKDEPTKAAALTLLGDYGWLTTDVATISHGTHWTVNARVHDMFAEHGEAARQRRETVRERFNGADNDEDEGGDQ